MVPHEQRPVGMGSPGRVGSGAPPEPMTVVARSGHQYGRAPPLHSS
jgi:hypothetical protein